MKSNLRQLVGMSAVLCFAATSLRADELPGNRYWFTPRVGFNVNAKIKGIGNGLLNGGTTTPRFTPDGDQYNYDDGYLLTDISGNFGGETWYVGYDDSAAQISGNTLLLSRTTASAGSASASEDADLSFGFEVGQQWQMGRNEKRAWGLQTAINWQSIAVSSRGNYAGDVTRVTDAYAFTPGTTPPTATPASPSTPASPYQGSYGGVGFLVGDAVVNTTTQVVPGGATVAARHELDGGMLGLHFGGYVEQALNDKWSVSLAGGFATAMLHVDGDWTETATTTGGGMASLSGGDEDWHALFGFYAGANVTWLMNESWSLAGGVQYQFLNDYSHSFEGRRTELDFSGAFYVTFGITKSF